MFNVLISQGRAWLVDWAWPTLGTAWLDPACWLLRLAARGHSVEQAEAYARQLSAYAAADPEHVDVFVRANISMWDEIVENTGIDWAKTMAQTARAWAKHRGVPSMRAR